MHLSQYLTAPPRTNQEKTIVVSCDADLAACQRTLDEYIPVVNAEFLLGGILRQEVEIDVYPLSICVQFFVVLTFTGPINTFKFH